MQVLTVNVLKLLLGFRDKLALKYMQVILQPFIMKTEYSDDKNNFIDIELHHTSLDIHYRECTPNFKFNFGYEFFILNIIYFLKIKLSADNNNLVLSVFYYHCHSTR